MWKGKELECKTGKNIVVWRVKQVVTLIKCFFPADKDQVAFVMRTFMIVTALIKKGIQLYYTAQPRKRTGLSAHNYLIWFQKIRAWESMNCSVLLATVFIAVTAFSRKSKKKFSCVLFSFQHRAKLTLRFLSRFPLKTKNSFRSMERLEARSAANRIFPPWTSF